MLSLAGRSKCGGRSGGDPLGLARQLEGRERRRHTLLGDVVDDLPHLEEGIKSGCCREHREGADTEKSEQQTAAYAETLKHRGDALIQLARPIGSAQIGSRRFAGSVVHYSNGTYSPPFQTYHTQL